MQIIGIFTRIDVDESFKCRTEYRILKYEHVCVKKYTFKGVKNERFIELVVSHIICDNSTQTWVVTRHQYGISALVSQTSFYGWWGREMSTVYSGKTKSKNKNKQTNAPKKHESEEKIKYKI